VSESGERIFIALELMGCRAAGWRVNPSSGHQTIRMVS
jgi:hypothetical protein